MDSPLPISSNEGKDIHNHQYPVLEVKDIMTCLEEKLR